MGGNAGKTLLPLLAVGTAGVAASSMGLLGGGAAAGSAAAPTTASFMAFSKKPLQLAANAAAKSWFGGISGSQALGLGLLGGSSLLNGLSAANQAQARENALQLQAARDSLNLAESEKESQRRLAQALGAQNNFYAATGTSASEGSALQAAEAAKRTGDEELSLYATQRRLNRYRPWRPSRTAIAAGSLLDFGTGAYNILKK